MGDSNTDNYYAVDSDASCTGLSNNSMTIVSGNLSAESKQLIELLIKESDEQKTKELMQLFNANQNKKTMIRVNKLSELLDTITDQALARFTARPDEISNKELFDGLKVVQDLIERGQKQVINAGETPLIQINQQTNEINVGGSATTLSRDSRERVKTAVMTFLTGLTANTESNSVVDTDIISVEDSEDNKNDQ